MLSPNTKPLNKYLDGWLRSLPPGTELGTAKAIRPSIPAEIASEYESEATLTKAIANQFTPVGSLMRMELVERSPIGGYRIPGAAPAKPRKAKATAIPAQAPGSDLEPIETPAPIPVPAVNGNGHHEEMGPLTQALEERHLQTMQLSRFINGMVNDLMEALDETATPYEFVRTGDRCTLNWDTKRPTV